ncbi:non-ribosomal peptide synthetase [Pelagibaculum spongiae]|uniref:Carrier domain-containing protein n=1 Tax=Pelagibaculum spongiae TaxID=2080658 RepID=A0A2V1GTG7_9GAMM|nr:non-ribosomal peptide synthetase [Pelagibaculum spongiae]PVZ68898.1 hypothetical protein DC094_11640 [Pelagibaculum spongiae]
MNNNNNAEFSIDESIALSLVQTDTFLDATLNPTSLKNSSGYALRFDGQADLAYWQAALDRLVSSQAILGVRLDTQSEQPFLSVTDTHHSLVLITAETNQPQELLNSLIYRNYDLHCEPMLGHWLVQAPDCYHLVITAHHLLLDGPSLGIHARLLIQAANQPDDLPKISTLAMPQGNFNSHETLAFWKSELAQVEPLHISNPAFSQTATLLNNPANTQVSAVATNASEPLHLKAGQRICEQLPFDAVAWQQVKDYCRSKKITPAFYFKCLFGLLIQYHQQAEQDFAITEIHDGRDQHNRNDLGCFTRQQPFLFQASQITAESSFSDWLLAARIHQKRAKPFLKLSPSAITHLPMASDTLFAFNFNNFVPVMSHQGQSVAVTIFTPQMPNLVQGYVHTAETTGRFELIYNSQQFSSNHFVERMALIHQQIVSGVERLDKLNWLLADEVDSLDASWQANFSADDCLIERFYQTAEKFPNHIALTDSSGSTCSELTYSQLIIQVNQLAQALRFNLDCGHFDHNQLDNRASSSDQLIGLCVNRGSQQIIAMLAILKAGYGYVPLDPQSPLQRIELIAEDADLQLLLTDQPLTLKTACRQLTLDQCLQQPVSEIEKKQPSPQLKPNPQSIAYVIYTSGTTGKPKGVPISHSAVMSLFDASEGLFSFSDKDCWSQFHSIAFDFSIWEIWGAFLYGGKLALVPEDARQNPQLFADWLIESQVTCLSQTPGAFKRVANCLVEGQKSGDLRHIHFGGEALELDSLIAWNNEFGLATPCLTNLYGITETTVHVTYKSISEEDLASNQSRIGQPLPHLSVRLRDALNRKVAPGIVGEIQVSGASLSGGYLNRPELNQQKFIEDLVNGGTGVARWYRSGDLARMDALKSEQADYQLTYLGRSDQQIKLRGYRIEIGEIVAQLRNSNLVADAAVVLTGKADAAQLIAYAVADGEVSEAIDNPKLSNPKLSNSQLSQQVLTSLQASLPLYMLPAQIIWLDQLPLTINGKLDKSALPSAVDSSKSAKSDFQPNAELPQSSIEKSIARIWQKVLQRKNINLQDHFFRLGGHSLQAAQSISELNAKFELTMPMTLIFKFPLLQDLAWEVERELTEAFYRDDPKPFILQAAIARKARRIEKEKLQALEKKGRRVKSSLRPKPELTAEPKAPAAVQSDQQREVFEL